jgi:hypothetical protein
MGRRDMKRSLMIAKLAEYVALIKQEPAMYDDLSDAEVLLQIVEIENGMLPPTQSPSIVDDGNGGQKHGPALRIWDNE